MANVDTSKKESPFLTTRGLSLLDKMIPEALKQEGGEVLRKARLLVAMSVPLLLASVWGLHPTWPKDGTLNPIFVINLVSIVVCTTILYFLWRSEDVRLSGLLFCGLSFLNFLSITSVTGGFRSLMLYWCTTTVLIAFLLLSMRWALFYSCLSAAVLFVYFNVGDRIKHTMPTYRMPSSPELAEKVFHGANLFLLLNFLIFIFVIGWIFEVSRRKAMEEREEAFERNKALLIAKNTAEASDRAKSEFLAQMSHELRTPLNAILGYTELIEEEAEDADIDNFSKDLTKVKSSAHHLLSLINELLDLSKIEAGKMEVEVEPFSLTALVRELGELLSPTMEKDGNQLRLHLPDQELIIESDYRKLKQILLNLLDNANKFTQQGEIDVTILHTEADGQEWVQCDIRDTGVGIAKDEQDQLFQIFSQASSANPRVHKGSGLGLVIVKQMCKLLGGDVSLESEPGKGSTFTVTLPCGAL